MYRGWQHYFVEKSILLHIDDALLVRKINHLAQPAAFCRRLTNCNLSFPEDEKAPLRSQEIPLHNALLSNYLLEIFLRPSTSESYVDNLN